MVKPKYILAVFLLLVTTSKAEALNINYSTVLDYTANNILISYNSIEKKQNYICNISTLACNKTKKTTLDRKNIPTINQTLKDELSLKKASHITMSPSMKWVAYLIGSKTDNPLRTFVIRDMINQKEFIYPNTIDYWDLVADQNKIFEFSPNEKSLIYLDDTDGALAMYSVDLDNLSGTEMKGMKLNTSALQVDDFTFTDNNTIYYIGNSKTNPYIWSLYRYDIKAGKDKVIDTMVSYTDSLIKTGSNIIYNHQQEDGYSPKLYNLKTKKIKQFKTPYTKENKIIKNQEVVKFGTLNGVLMKPTSIKTQKSYSLVIWLHGGPYRQASYGYHPYHSYGIYDTILELLRKNGVIVLKLDYRGSLGFGRPYSESIRTSVGKGDVDDVMDSITYIKSRYKLDKIYLAGNSYGGYMSLRTLVEHPDSFTGVMSINGVTDWESLLNSMQTSIFNTHFNGAPNGDNQSLYDQASIINRIGNVGNQKIAIVAGEADKTIPYWQAVMLYDKLKENNKNVNLISYPGEDHVYFKKKTIQNLCTELFKFVGKTADKECSK